MSIFDTNSFVIRFQLQMALQKQQKNRKTQNSPNNLFFTTMKTVSNRIFNVYCTVLQTTSKRSTFGLFVGGTTRNQRTSHDVRVSIAVWRVSTRGQHPEARRYEHRANIGRRLVHSARYQEGHED